MRLSSALVFLLVLSACDDAGQPAADTGGDRPQISAEQVEAERVCAEMTGHTPSGADPAAATASKRQEEYKDCVAAVTGGGPPELRGRTEEPAQ